MAILIDIKGIVVLAAHQDKREVWDSKTEKMIGSGDPITRLICKRVGDIDAFVTALGTSILFDSDTMAPQDAPADLQGMSVRGPDDWKPSEDGQPVIKTERLLIMEGHVELEDSTEEGSWDVVPATIIEGPRTRLYGKPVKNDKLDKALAKIPVELKGKEDKTATEKPPKEIIVKNALQELPVKQEKIVGKGTYNPNTGAIEYSLGNGKTTSVVRSRPQSQPLKVKQPLPSLTSGDKVAVSFDEDGEYTLSSVAKKCDCLSVDDVMKIVSSVVSNMVQSEVKKLEAKLREELKPHRGRKQKEAEQVNNG